MLKKIKYLYSKMVLRLQIPSVRDSKVHYTSKIGYRSNVINLQMGKYSYTGNNCSISNVVIGNYCSISSYCSIGGEGHPTDWVSTSPIFYTENSSLNKSFISQSYNHGNKVIIGNDVWIGEKCFIKSGVKIGNGVIVGAHSVVTKDIPDYAIVVGAPAKVIKYRFDESVIKELLNIKWWEFDEIKIKKYCCHFNDPIKFIEKYNYNRSK